MTIVASLQRWAVLAGMAGQVWLGRMGGLGLLLLVVAVAAFAWAPRLAGDAESLREQYAAEGVRIQERASRHDADPGRLQEFHDGFPESGQSLADLRAIFRIAREQQLQLTRGDYAAARRPEAGLSTVDVVLPVKTSYVALRAFVAAVLNELPNASLVELRLERTGGTQVNARLHLTLYYRET